MRFVRALVSNETFHFVGNFCFASPSNIRRFSGQGFSCSGHARRAAHLLRRLGDPVPCDTSEKVPVSAAAAAGDAALLRQWIFLRNCGGCNLPHPAECKLNAQAAFVFPPKVSNVMATSAVSIVREPSSQNDENMRVGAMRPADVDAILDDFMTSLSDLQVDVSSDDSRDEDSNPTAS